MAKTMIIPGRGRVKVENSIFGCGVSYSSKEDKPRESMYERTKREVYATNNKWAIENFHATHD